MKRSDWLVPRVMVLLLIVLGVVMSGNAVFADQGDVNAEVGEAATETNGEPAVPAAPDEVGAGMLADAWASFVVYWNTGGPTMYFLAALAMVAIVFSLDRLIGLQRYSIAPKGLATTANGLWQKKDYRGIVEVANAQESALSEVVGFLVEHRNNSYEHLTSAAEDIASRHMEVHSRRVYPLIAVGTMAPLLGLLGTVFGLLGAFRTIGVVGSMDDPSALAGDIGEALITTAAGLIVALPTLAGYHYFRSRTSQYAGLLSQEINGLMHAWFLRRADEEPVIEPPVSAAKPQPTVPAVAEAGKSASTPSKGGDA